MITKEIALAATHGTIFYHLTARNKDGSSVRARVNGKCKTWKREPDRFKLPMKHGLKECFDINQTNACVWCETEVQTIVEGP